MEVEPRYGHEPAQILPQRQVVKTARKPLDLHKSRDNVTQDHAVSVCNFYFDEILFKQLLTSNSFLFFFAHCLFSEIRLRRKKMKHAYDTLILTSVLSNNS